MPAVGRDARKVDGCRQPATGRADGSGRSAVARARNALPNARCSTAIINGDDRAVLGGPRDALKVLGDAATAQGARVTLLPVSVPAHTPWLSAAAEGFTLELAAAQLNAPTLRVLAGINARAVNTQALVIDTLSAQIAQTVRWYEVLVQAAERGARVFLELGPGSALARMAREVLPECQVRSVDEFHSTDGVVEWVTAACERAA
nr:acyltransferase domain-containing protein [Xanthomonas vasicola]